MNETTAVNRTCVLCKEPIDDPIYELYYDPVTKEIVYRHKRGYCADSARKAPYAYMKRLGQTKYD